jgi:hypothetical protein
VPQTTGQATFAAILSSYASAPQRLPIFRHRDSGFSAT